MSRNVLMGFFGGIAVSLVIFMLLWVFWDTYSLQASDSDSSGEAMVNLVNRIDAIENTFAGLQEVQDEEATQDTEATAASPDYTLALTDMADSLRLLAEKADKVDTVIESLNKIVEGLGGIEQELAWSRLDKEEEQAEGNQ